jgi:surfeit locus 1 family protein
VLSRLRSVLLATLRDPQLLALHGLLVLVLIGTATAGWWQLGAWRAEQSDDVVRRLERDPVPLTEALRPDDPLANEDLGVPVTVRGRYADRQQQFLVAGREQDGEDGFWVLSPLEVAGTDSSLLVVRGWSAEQTLPPVPAGTVEETGVLQMGEEGSGAVLPGRVVTDIRIPALVQETARDLYGAYLLRTAADPADPATDLATVDPPRPDPSWTAGLRNLAYGIQWWVFGGFAVFVWWRTCVDRVAAISVAARDPQVPSSR